jgi:hypothetical protein
VTARAGEPVRVPPAPTPDTVVYARLDVRPTAKERLASLLLKPAHLPSIRVGGNSYRLVTDTARGPLVLRLPRAVGISGGVDYPELTLENVASPFGVRFYAVPLRHG